MFRDGLYRIDFGASPGWPFRSALVIVRNGRLLAADQSGSVYVGTTRPSPVSKGWKLALGCKRGKSVDGPAGIDPIAKRGDSSNARNKTTSGEHNTHDIEFEIEFCYLGPPPD